MPRALARLALLAPLALLSCARAPDAARAARATAARADAPLTLRYLGVAGWELAGDSHALLVDPYFSRVRVEDGAAPLSPARDVVAAYAPKRADVILVGHSHYDHLLDVPLVAAETGAFVMGTESTLNVARAAGVPDARLVLARPHETRAFGPFTVRVIPALHALTGQERADIPRGVTLPMAADAYGEGGTLQYLVRVAGRAVLFIGTANFIEGELDGVHPDVAVVATGLREKIPDYTCRLMNALGRPKLVLANHFDAFRRPLGPAQLDIGDDGRASLARFADEVHACAPATTVMIPVHFQAISI